MIKKFTPKITGKRWEGFSRFPNLLALEIASTLTRDFSRELGCFLVLKIKSFFGRNKIL